MTAAMAKSPQAQQPQAAELPYIALRIALNGLQKTPPELTEEERSAVDAQAAREYVLGNRILASPEAQEVMVPEASITAVLDEIRGRYEAEDAFHASLLQNKLDEETLLTSIERELRIEAVLDRVASRAAEVSELDVMIYYYMHADRFQVAETRTARHILITINPQFPDNTREAALARVNAIAQRLDRKPHRFEEQAGKHSECPTALHGGLIGRVPRGQLYPELDDVLFTMKHGQVSDIVESSMGFHILWCESVEAGRTLSLDEVRPRIVEVLEKRRRRMCQRHWLKGLGAEE